MPRNLPGRSGTVCERFWRKVRKGEPDECWEWIGTKNGDGYGRFHIWEPDGKRLVGAHRQSWEWANGRAVGELCVCHTCDNPACVNPAHLFLGTHIENMRDRDAKGRRQPLKGEANGRAKLLAAEVACMRVEHAAGRGTAELAAKYGVSRGTVQSIVRGQTWKAA